MEPLNGVIPSAFVNATPQSLKILPVPGQEETAKTDLSVDKEREKSLSNLKKAEEISLADVPAEMRVSVHSELKQLMVKIVDQHGDTLREVPAKETLDRVADIVKRVREREEAQREAIRDSIDRSIEKLEGEKRKVS